jgi:predicted metal-dependent HD superfamily phosphohydrolase
MLTLSKDIQLYLNLESSVASDLEYLIAQHYSESHRYYHTLVHISHFTELMKEYINTIEDVESFYLALLFHDCIYNPTSKTNEEDSNTVFLNFCLRYSLYTITIQQKVSNLILATKTHDLSPQDVNSIDTQLFLDMDMSVVGLPRPDYCRYALNIRKEYKHIAVETYCRERSKFLKSFKDKVVFKTKIFQDLYEDRAKGNMSWECNILDQGRLVCTTDAKGSSEKCGELVPFHKSDDNSMTISYRVMRSERMLTVDYTLQGDVSNCKIEQQQIESPYRTEQRLWEHTCLEVFVSPAASLRYAEYNVSPTGNWSIYSFSNYRQLVDTHENIYARPVTVQMTKLSAELVSFRVSVNLSDTLDTDDIAGHFDVGLAVVLETNEGTLGYWAVEHTRDDVPDFHDRRSLSLQL